jgi:hypothetical protein
MSSGRTVCAASAWETLSRKALPIAGAGGRVTVGKWSGQALGLGLELRVVAAGCAQLRR